MLTQILTEAVTRQHVLSMMVEHNRGDPAVIVETLQTLKRKSFWGTLVSLHLQRASLRDRINRASYLLQEPMWTGPMGNEGRLTEAALLFLDKFNSLPD